MSVKEYIGKQCANPTGIVGSAATKLMNVTNSDLYRAVKKFVPKEDNLKILDVGFGNGYMLKKLSKITSSKLYGIDVSEDMIEKAWDKNSDSASLNKIMLSLASVTDLPYNDSFFDCVYTINTIYFWGDCEKAFGEILRVLKSGGRFVCGFYGKDYLDKIPYCDTGFDKLTPRQVRAMARRYGFENVTVKIVKKDKSFCLVGEKP